MAFYALEGKEFNKDGFAFKWIIRPAKNTEEPTTQIGLLVKEP